MLIYLFPKGQFGKRKFFIGNLQGDPGDSLQVELGGDRAGLWLDRATDDRGDIIDLWRGATGAADFAAVVEEIRRWLATEPASPAPSELPTRASAELGPVTGKWQYHDPAGNIVAVVYRYDPPSGKEFRPYDVKTGQWRAPEPRPLYNLPGIMNADEVVLVEGEKAAQTGGG